MTNFYKHVTPDGVKKITLLGFVPQPNLHIFKKCQNSLLEKFVGIGFFIKIMRKTKLDAIKSPFENDEILKIFIFVLFVLFV